MYNLPMNRNIINFTVNFKRLLLKNAVRYFLVEFIISNIFDINRSFPTQWWTRCIFFFNNVIIVDNLIVSQIILHRLYKIPIFVFSHFEQIIKFLLESCCIRIQWRSIICSDVIFSFSILEIWTLIYTSPIQSWGRL